MARTPKPQARQPLAPEEKQNRLKCPFCGAGLRLPGKMRKKPQVACPKCKGEIPWPDKSAVDKPDKKDPAEEVGGEKGDRKKGGLGDKRNQALAAWKDFEESRKDSFWVAVIKAGIYPYKVLGALAFFVIGVPVTVAIVEAAAKWALKEAAGSETFSPEEKLYYFSAGVVVFALAVSLALVSFFCSFLFSVVRTSTEGRTSTPVIEGMHHRSNLAAVCAWAGVYFGPGLYIGHALAGGGVYAWTWPGALVLFVMALLAPMGFLYSATVSAVAGMNLIAVVRAILRCAPEYLYLLVAFAISSAAFVALGFWIGAMAAEEMLQAGGMPYGLFLRILSSLFYMFPPVVLARSLGLLMQYRQERLPISYDAYSEHRGGMVPQVIAAIGVLALFGPMVQGAVIYAKQAGKGVVAADHLKSIYVHHLLDASSRRVNVRNDDELRATVQGEVLHCPARPEVFPMYAVAPNDGYRKETREFIWIYEKQATDPEGRTVNVLLHSGRVKCIRLEKLDELLEIMAKHQGASSEEQERIYDEYEVKLALP